MGNDPVKYFTHVIIVIRGLRFTLSSTESPFSEQTGGGSVRITTV